MKTSLVDLVSVALDEDIGSGDVSAKLLTASRFLRAKVLARESCVVCGVAYVNEVFRQVNAAIQIKWFVKEGDQIQPGTILAECVGPGPALLAAERVALNFLQTLSGVATITRAYVNAVSHSQAKIYDTRKTLPGWRMAQKMAVRVGGGMNHRMGLYDAFLIKENHIAALGSIQACVTRARQNHPDLLLQLEVETIAQLKEAIEAKVPLILLDNFTLSAMREAVNLTAGRAALEASGNITLDNIAAIADTGVDRISIGALTKHVRAVDLSFQVIESLFTNSGEGYAAQSKLA